MGYLNQYPCGEQKRQKKDDPFFLHTILFEPGVGRNIDHVLRSKNGCLILNPASHLRLHDNLQGGYFKKIKFIVKLTYTKSDNLYSKIYANINGITYHTNEEEVELKEYIKRILGVTGEINSTHPLMKKHVHIQQLISYMNNVRSRDPFQYTRKLYLCHLLDKVSFWMMYSMMMRNVSRLFLKRGFSRKNAYLTIMIRLKL
jgi:hypothetical protein